jgi:hypothetical protein
MNERMNGGEAAAVANYKSNVKRHRWHAETNQINTPGGTSVWETDALSIRPQGQTTSYGCTCALQAAKAVRQKVNTPNVGLEPTTPGLRVPCSTD